MKHRVHHNLLVFFLLAILTCGAVHADQLRFEISDPAGDAFNTGIIDLTNLILDFDNVTGAYTILVDASAAHPFSGFTRLNLFFLNPDTGLGLTLGAVLVDNVNDFSLSSPTTFLSLTGVSSVLTLWDAGDRVAINSTPFGTPAGLGLAFGSGVLAGQFPFLTGTDIFGSPGGANYGIITVAPSPVPEPGSGMLFSAGSFLLVGGAAYLRRRRRQD